MSVGPTSARISGGGTDKSVPCTRLWPVADGLGIITALAYLGMAARTWSARASKRAARHRAHGDQLDALRRLGHREWLVRDDSWEQRRTETDRPTAQRCR